GRPPAIIIIAGNFDIGLLPIGVIEEVDRVRPPRRLVPPPHAPRRTRILDADAGDGRRHRPLGRCQRRALHSISRLCAISRRWIRSLGVEYRFPLYSKTGRGLA